MSAVMWSLAKPEQTDPVSVSFLVQLKERKLSMFDLWRFGFDVQEVIAARVVAMMKGELSQREVRRMIIEKQAAYSNAQIAGAYALLTGGPVEAGREMIGVYQRTVTANCVRLSGVPRSSY